MSQITSVPPGLTFTSAKRWKSMSCQRLWPKWFAVTYRNQPNCGPPAPQAPCVAAIQPAAAGVPQNAIAGPTLPTAAVKRTASGSSVGPQPAWLSPLMEWSSKNPPVGFAGAPGTRSVADAVEAVTARARTTSASAAPMRPGARLRPVSGCTRNPPGFSDI